VRKILQECEKGWMKVSQRLYESVRKIVWKKMCKVSYKVWIRLYGSVSKIGLIVWLSLYESVREIIWKCVKDCVKVCESLYENVRKIGKNFWESMRKIVWECEKDCMIVWERLYDSVRKIVW
jgi:hypothetical protein